MEKVHILFYIPVTRETILDEVQMLNIIIISHWCFSMPFLIFSATTYSSFFFKPSLVSPLISQLFPEIFIFSIKFHHHSLASLDPHLLFYHVIFLLVFTLDFFKSIIFLKKLYANISSNVMHMYFFSQFTKHIE